MRQHDEFVAAEPVERVPAPQTGVDSLNEGLEQLVAHMMPQRVIHELELVEIEQQQMPAIPKRSDVVREAPAGCPDR